MVGDQNYGPQYGTGYLPPNQNGGGNQGITYGEPPPGSAGNGSFGQPPAEQQQQPQAQPQQNLSREDYRDKWMSSGVKDQAGLTNFLNQYGGTQLSGNGTVKTPYGDDVIDMLIGARSGGNGMPGWTGLPGMSQSQVTPWNGQQQGGGNNQPQNPGPFNWSGASQGAGNQWLMQMLQQMQRQNPQNMPYNRNQGGGGQGPISNYYGGGQQTQNQSTMPWWTGNQDMGQNNQRSDVNGPGGQWSNYGSWGQQPQNQPGGNWGYGGMTGRQWGQWNPNWQSLTGSSGGSGISYGNEPIYHAGNPDPRMPQ